MSLAVARRFPTLPEAQVAASVLRSAGIAAQVLDQYYGGLDWTAQSALGGYRLCTSFEDLADAREILLPPPLEPDDAEAPAGPSGSLARTALALTAAWLVGGEGGWLVAGLRKRTAPSAAELVLGATMGFALAVAALGAISGVVFVVHELLIDPP
jgi:hypothetical protein